MTCLIPKCPNPREHNSGWCAPHLSLVSQKLRDRFAFQLSRMVRYVGTDRQDRTTQAFYAARNDVTQAIQEAIAEAREL